MKRGHFLTEQLNQATMNLDALPLDQAFDAVNDQDRQVANAVRRAKPQILAAIRTIVRSWKAGGRLIYVGAGTSGRLGVLDASECPPTFRSDPKMVQGIIAGGRKALWRSIEGAEDDVVAAAAAIRRMKVVATDAVMGIATGGSTPFVHAALAEARRRDATTIFLACVPKRQFRAQCDIDIRVLTGPEALSGSTRMKAGTATKLVLNTITTLGMVQLGKVYGNLMVDLNSYACRKLTDRAARVVASVTGRSYRTALGLLSKARGKAKTAMVMDALGIGRNDAERLLQRHNGHLRTALSDRPRRPKSMA